MRTFGQAVRGYERILTLRIAGREELLGRCPLNKPRLRAGLGNCDAGGMNQPIELAAAARWREVVRAQAASGLSVAAYCRRARVPASSFYTWRRKLRDAGAFVAVRVSPAADPAADRGKDPGALELHLPRGRRVIVRRGFDRQTLRDLLATLEAGA